MAFVDKARALSTKLKLGPHFAMERFAAMVGVFVVLGALIMGGGLAKSIEANQIQVGTTAVYRPMFETSKTKVSGEVVDLYTSQDRTRAFLLMKFNEIGKVSTDANTYQAFITGLSPSGVSERLKSNPSGSVYVFGNTGYMGLYMVDAEGFDQQIISLTMRANSELVVPGDDIEAVDGDDSFVKNDQWRLLINPGAEGTTHTPALDNPEMDAASLYNETVVSTQEKEIRETLDKDLVEMRTSLSQIDEYTRRLIETKVDGLSVVPPKVPEQIAGDRVEGEPGTPEKESTLRLETDHVINSGFNFDWRSGSVSDGYLSDVVPPGRGDLEYLVEKSKQKDESVRVNMEDWKFSNGALLTDYAGTDAPAMSTVNETVSLLTGAYDEYYRQKVNYQTKDLRSLLMLEMDLKDMRQNVTINSDENVLLQYGR